MVKVPSELSPSLFLQCVILSFFLKGGGGKNVPTYEFALCPLSLVPTAHIERVGDFHTWGEKERVGRPRGMKILAPLLGPP